MSEPQDYDGYDDNYINCAECLQSWDNSENDMKECVYCEDSYCNFGQKGNKVLLNHYEAHMKESHYVYYREVVKVYTQHKSRDKQHAEYTIRKFIRNGAVIIEQANGNQLYHVIEGKRGAGWKFDYKRMSEEKSYEFLEELSA